MKSQENEKNAGIKPHVGHELVSHEHPSRTRNHVTVWSWSLTPT